MESPETFSVITGALTHRANLWSSVGWSRDAAGFSLEVQVAGRLALGFGAEGEGPIGMDGDVGGVVPSCEFACAWSPQSARTAGTFGPR
jgi:hypothetical protein